ncbi:MAG: HAMP domain-containing protein [Saprospiraceae bacterium]|nr:HAMP domain-containing protein [Saprospiraceae bacterium]
MKIKTKLTLGVGLLFLLIVLLATIGVRQIWKLSDETKSILKANYNTLDYVRHMFTALDNMQADQIDTASVSTFRENLLKQAVNITEAGEKDATKRLNVHFEQLLKTPENKTLPAEIRNDLNEIMHLNMSAILQKSKSAETTADKAIIWIGITGALCFIIAFILMVNMPGNIADPIRELTENIRQIAGRKYDQRVHFKSGSEFGDLAEAFNTMAAKLQEYESSNLSKILNEKKRIETLINNMQEPIIGLDENRRVIFANQEALKLLNLKQAELVGQHAKDVAASNDLMRSLVMDILEPSKISGGKSEPLKIFADNQESYFEKEIIPVNLARTGEREARHLGDVILLKNITTLKTLDLAKTNLLRTISNELRAPVASILSVLNNMENEPAVADMAQQAQRLSMLREESERLLKITGTLLSLSQVESGNIVITPQELNVSEIVNYALETVKNQAAQKQVGIVVKIEENLPPLMADTDKTAWVLVNFLVNAIRYSPEKSEVIVEVKRENGSVRFSVQDFGKGIEGKYKDRVFERYFRVPGSDKQGIGLALAIGKEFIIAQGGNIGVESEYGSGTRFWFQLKTNQLA